MKLNKNRLYWGFESPICLSSMVDHVITTDIEEYAVSNEGIVESCRNLTPTMWIDKMEIAVVPPK